MVGGLAEAFNDLNAPMCIGGGIRDNLLEQVHFHKPGAAEGREHAAFGQELHGEQVDVLVAAGSLLQVVLAFYKLGRVQHNEVEGFGLVAALAQVLEHVGFHMGGMRRAEFVAHDTFLGELESVLGNIHLINFFATAAESIEPEAAGIAEAVQNLLALREFANAAASVALVQVVTGLVTVLHVDGEENSVFVDDDRFVGYFAVNTSGAQLQAFFFAHVGIAAFVNAAAVRLFGQQFINIFAVDFSAGSQDFHRIDVGVLVDNAARNAVVFGIDQAEGAVLVFDVKAAALAGGNGAVEQVAKEFAIDVSLFAEGPEAPTDLGLGRVRRKTQKIALVAVNFNGVAKFRVADNFVNGSAKNPGVVTQCGLFASGFQGNRFHECKCRKSCCRLGKISTFGATMFESLFDKYPFFRAVPCVLCMAIIFKLSSLTNEQLEDFPHIWDKLAHFCEYATLAGCYAMLWTRNEWSKRQWLRVLIVGVLALAYGCTDEYHQSFVEGRDCSALDLVADLTGGLTGGVAYAIVTRILNRYDPVSEKKSNDGSTGSPT